MRKISFEPCHVIVLKITIDVLIDFLDPVVRKRHANLILAMQKMDLRDDRAINSEDDLFAELERITNGHF